MVYNGDAGQRANGSRSAVSPCAIFQNGVFVNRRIHEFGLERSAVHASLGRPAGQALYVAGGDNEWLGSLSDMGMWNVALTSGTSIGQTAVAAPTGGEVSALYNTPDVQQPHRAAVPIRRQGDGSVVHPLRRGQPTNAAVVTTSNGTLAWRYVASGLTAGSGGAGKLGNSTYFVQLDSNGGGVESVLTGDTNRTTRWTSTT